VADPAVERAVIEEMLTQRKLSTRDKQFFGGLNRQMEGVKPEIPSAGDVASIMREIQRTQDPVKRGYLMQELDKMKAIMQQLPPGAGQEYKFQYPITPWPPPKPQPMERPRLDNPIFDLPFGRPKPPVYES
jgi:hypothetical protein